MINGKQILEVRNLHKSFSAGKPSLIARQETFIKAVDGVSFALGHGEILALVGESGCGKTTLAQTLIGLEQPTSGQVIFQGQDVTNLKPSGLKALRQKIQMIFQDPYESLNPTQSIAQIIEEPLFVHNLESETQRRHARVCRALEDAGLKPVEVYLARYPHELSGGQRQRVVIAGALVLEPVVLIADEPVSMLDVSIRAEILNLLLDLRQQRDISVLFITHDLGTVAYFADRIAVMYLGRIVELGATHQVLTNPQHPYTKALLSVVPVPNPRLRRQRMILQGETPNPLDIPGGCRFHPRCPVAVDRCRSIDPEQVMVEEKHSAACLLLT